MKLLIVPDIHLGKSSHLGKEDLSGNNSRIEDQKRLLNFTLQQANKEKVDRIILTGDVFDHYNPRFNLVVLFMEWISECRQNFPVDIILGNHDFVKSDKNRSTIVDCALYVGCNVIKDITSYYEDVKITYLPYTDRRLLGKDTIQEATDCVVNSIKETIDPSTKNILIGHLSLQGSFFIGDEVEDDSNEIFLPLDSFEGYDAVFMGHVHKYQNLSSYPLISHVGSLDKTAFDEGSKYLVIYDTNTNEVKEIELPTRNLVDLVIKVPQEVDHTEYILSQINEVDMNDSIVRIKIETSSIDAIIDKKKILSTLSKKNIHNISSFVESRKNEKPISKNAELNETIDHNKAVDMAVKLLKADPSFIQDVASACKTIINQKD